MISGLPQIPPEVAWYLPLLWLVWEVYAPKFGVNTRVSEITNGINGRIDAVGKRIDSIEETQRDHISITEYIAIEHQSIDGEAVAETLSDEDEDLSYDDFVHDDPYVTGEKNPQKSD